MSLFSNLRKKWLQHDEKLAEEHEHGAHSDLSLASARTADRAVDKAVQSEDALEHEKPE